MKITTQRTLVWGINFALVLAMLGLVLVMSRHSERIRGERRVKATRDLDNRLAKIKGSGGNAGTDTAVVGNLASVLSGNFVGPVSAPVRQPTNDENPNAKAVAPDINTLIELVAIYASARSAESGPVTSSSSAVVVKHKSKPNDNVYFYYEGEVIGLGTLEDAKEVENKMKEFGGARILRIEPEQVVLKWGEGEVTVKVPTDPEPRGGVFVDQNGVKFGTEKAGARGPLSALEDGENFKLLPSTQDGRDTVEITVSGMKTLDESGDQLIERVAFDTVDGEGETKNLKVTSLPPELADKGFREGDVILRVDNEPVTTRESIISYVKRTYKNKTSYLVTLLRDGNMRTVEVKVPRGIDVLRNRQQSQLNNRGAAVPR